MEKVVDSNYLQREELKTYLLENDENKVVLVDYIAIEAYKDGSIRSLLKLFETLSKFPQRVIVLKPTGDICGIELKFLEDLIHYESTNEFPNFCRKIKAAKRGNRSIQRELLDKCKQAKRHMEKGESFANVMVRAIEDAKTIFTRDELNFYKEGQPFPQEMLLKFTDYVFRTAIIFHSEVPSFTALPSFERKGYYFVFRYALCICLLVVDWLSEGGAQGVSDSKMNNDAVDMIIVAYATYFDGILTNDKKAQRIYEKAAELLRFY